MRTLTKAEVLSLSVPERIQLVEDIWDTIAEVPEQIVLSDALLRSEERVVRRMR